MARGAPGGYRIWDNKAHRWWGDLYQLCPDDLLDELNGGGNYDKITALLNGIGPSNADQRSARGPRQGTHLDSPGQIGGLIIR